MFRGDVGPALVFMEDGTVLRGNTSNPAQFTVNADGSYTAHKLDPWGEKRK